jgi:Na+-dependent bicarbonate transporter superfamily
MTTEVLRPVRAGRPANRGRERVFFGGMTLLMIGTVLLGFRQTYFPLGAKPDALASRVIQVHGTLFSLFLALFFVQVGLVAARRVRWHKSLGLWIYGLACVMIPVGVAAAADEIKRDLKTGPPFYLGIDPRTFSIVSVMGMVMFGALLAASYALRRRPDAHKRLALYATLSMMDAGCDRWPWRAWGLSESWSLWVYTLFLLLPVLYDLVSLRRVHRATLFAAPYVWLLHRLEIPLGHTRAWRAVAETMLRHAL